MKQLSLVCFVCFFALMSVPSILMAADIPSHTHTHDHDHTHAHVAPHDGVLSVIEGCGLGHVEAKVTGTRLELWFLDGGESINRSIPIPDLRFPLSIIGEDGERYETILLAEPLRLAGEKAGRCSHFVAEVKALEKMSAFTGYAWVRFKGEMRPIRIEWSAKAAQSRGHDHEHDADHDHHQQGKTAPESRKDSAHSQEKRP